MRLFFGGLCVLVGLGCLGWGIKELIFLRAAWGWVSLGMLCVCVPWIGALRTWRPMRRGWRLGVLGLTGVLWIAMCVGLVLLGVLHHAVRDQAILNVPLRTVWGKVEEHQFAAAGHTSSYRLFVPKRADLAQPTGLLVFLHGAGFTGRIYERWLADSFYPRAQALGWAVIFPSAGSGKDMVRRLWNDGSRPETTKALGIPLQRPWLRALVQSLCKQYQIASKKVFWVGHSNGAAMAMSFVALESGAWGGLVAISGAISAGRLAQKPIGSPLPVLLVHGEKDALIPIKGRNNGKERVFVSAHETLSSWSQHNGCLMRGPFAGIRPPETSKAGGIDILFYPQRCRYPALLWSFRQGGHMLPGVPLEKGMTFLLGIGGDGKLISEVTTARLVFDFLERASVGRTFDFLEKGNKQPTSRRGITPDRPTR